jgi:hypothetical protein
MKKKANFPLGWLLLLSCLAWARPLPAQAGAPSPGPETGRTDILHTPVQKFVLGQELKIVAQSPADTAWMRFFYRAEGFQDFQVRPMEKKADNAYVYSFDTSQLLTAKFEYYLAARIGEEVFLYPRQAPQNPLAVSGTETPAAQAKFSLPFSIMLNGSVQDRTGESQAAAGGAAAAGDGNIRLFRNYQKPNLEINFDTNFAYSSHPLPGGPDITLSNLAVSLKIPHHTFQAGDIFISHSPLTIFGLGRRGAAYQFQSPNFSFQVFDVSSQQASGWGGLLPRAGANLYGGAAGYSAWGGRLSFKVVYVAGRDDPALATNVAGSALAQRKGAVLSIIPELQLFKNALKITAEYSRSACDQNLQDKAGNDKDSAWQAGGSLTLGRISLAGRYKHIGRRFFSIGQQYLVNDRRGYDVSLALVGKKIQLAANFLQDGDNVGRDPDRSLSLDWNGGALVYWTALPWLSFNVGYRRDAQKIYDGPDKTALSDQKSTEDVSLGLGLTLGTSATLQYQAVWSRLRSDFDPLRNQEALIMNLGGIIRRGATFSLSSNFGFSIFGRSLNNRDVQSLNAFLMGELAILPRALTLTGLGSFNRTRSGPENIDNLNATALLNFHLGSISRHLESAIVSLGGEVRRMTSAYFSDKSEWLKLQFHFSF